MDPKFFSQATKEKLKLEEEYGRKFNQIQKMMNYVRSLQQQVQDTQEQHAKNTQVFLFGVYFPFDFFCLRLCAAYSWGLTVQEQLTVWEFFLGITYYVIPFFLENMLLLM